MTTILQVLPELETGGVERTTVDIAGAISRNGWRSLVACQKGGMLEELKQNDAVHFELPAKSKNPIVIALNSHRLRKIINLEKVDLVHARSRAPAWSAYFAAKACGIPMVTTYHGTYSQNSWLKGVYNSSMIRSDGIIANSNFIANLISRRHPQATNRITVIHRGIDCKEFDDETISDDRVETLKMKWKLPKNCRIVFNSARLTKWKGQIGIIAAFSEIAGDFPDLHLIIAGSAQGRTGYEEEVRKFASNSSHGDRVHIVGHCNDIPAAIKLSNCAVVGSIEPEAFGRAAVEAQAGGKPCIVTNLGAAVETVLAPPEVSPELRTGWRVPPNDTQSMASALREALSLDLQKQLELSIRARAHAKNNFSKSRMCEKTVQLYEQILIKF